MPSAATWAALTHLQLSAVAAARRLHSRRNTPTTLGLSIDLTSLTRTELMPRLQEAYLRLDWGALLVKQWPGVKIREDTPKFNLAKCDEREAAADEAPPHRDGDVTITPREANTWREVSSPANLHQ